MVGNSGVGEGVSVWKVIAWEMALMLLLIYYVGCVGRVYVVG